MNLVLGTQNITFDGKPNLFVYLLNEYLSVRSH